MNSSGLSGGDTNIRYLVQNGVRIWNEWPFQYYLEQNGLSEAHPKHSDSWESGNEDFRKTNKGGR